MSNSTQHNSIREGLPLITAVSIGGVMASLDTFILYVATPNLRGEFSATIAEISWVSTSYAITSMLFMLISSKIVERKGRKQTYQIGLVLFVIGSVLCALADNLISLTIFRALQGIGAGILLPVEGVILRSSFPQQRHGVVLAIYSVSIMFGPAFGPMLGGIIIDEYSWPLLFLINLPFGIISMVMVNKFVADDKPNDSATVSKIDYIGIILLAASTISLVGILERGDRTFWFEDTTNVYLFMLCISSFITFIAHELMIDHPVVGLTALQDTTFRTANTINFLGGFVVSGTLFILPIYMQETLYFSPTQAGTSMAPRAIVMMGAFLLVGYLFNRVKLKNLILFGLTLAIISGLMMSRFTHDTGWHDMILPQVIQGIGVAFVLGPVTTVAMMNTSQEKLAGAAALESTTRLLGSTIGIATFATLITHYELKSWGLLRHNITFSNPVLYKRFSGVLEFFMVRVPSESFALEMSLRRLNSRVMEQVLALTYMNIFQIITGIFVFMMLLLIFGIKTNKLKAGK
ncbi:MAG: DHA2 family efflux MFS transporter permease subunit [Cellvibrionales bacterium]|nr:DHA2 family efflux MFS transporter permease subunit [Cellvibrionales bacterium]